MFHQLVRRRAHRVFRQRFSIDNMGEKEIRIRRRYRFGKDSIKQIVDLLEPIVAPKTKISQTLSMELQVHNWQIKLTLHKSLSSNEDWKQEGLVAHFCLYLITSHMSSFWWRILYNNFYCLKNIDITCHFKMYLALFFKYF